jgi:hypothetical protein
MKVTLNNLHLNTLAAHLRPLPANRLPVFRRDRDRECTRASALPR